MPCMASWLVCWTHSKSLDYITFPFYQYMYFQASFEDSQPTIHLMHNDVKQCFHGSKVHCRSCSHERIQYLLSLASYFPEAGNLNSSNADMCSDVAELSGRSNETISPTTSTYTSHHLRFEYDYNFHSTFWGTFCNYVLFNYNICHVRNPNPPGR